VRANACMYVDSELENVCMDVDSVLATLHATLVAEAVAAVLKGVSP